MEGLWVGTGSPVAVAGVFVVEHIGMRIVLLFCTHGINLGRTELYLVRKGGGGTACRAALYELEMEMDRSLSGSQLYYPLHYCDLYLPCWVSYLAAMIDLPVYLALTAVAESMPETQAAAAAVVVAELSYRR